MAAPDGITLSYETYALVRDFVHASEGEPIRVKGIAREIRPYAVVGLRDDLARSSRYISRDSKGLQLFVDLQELKGRARKAAIVDMKAALQAIEGSRSGRRKAAAKRN